MAVEKRATFNQVAELYDQVRPRYPARLFDDLVALSGLPHGGRILEMGAGTGIATLPLAERGYRIVAIELGAELAAVARKKLSQFDNVDVVVANFEEWRLPREPFDLVLGATAWHWSTQYWATRRPRTLSGLEGRWPSSVICTSPVAIEPSSTKSRTATCGSCQMPILTRG
jgi:ubiquinone/menaquinone biosynthesis C-methylase UbiE